MSQVQSCGHKSVKDRIYEALIQLIEEKDYSDISIGEIVELAGVSRMSYYRNYESKEDILRKRLDEHYLYCQKRLMQMPGMSEREMWEEVFTEFQKTSLPLVLMKLNLTSHLVEPHKRFVLYMYEHYFHWDLSNANNRMIVYGLIGGLGGLLRLMLENGNEIDMDFALATFKAYEESIMDLVVS